MAYVETFHIEPFLKLIREQRKKRKFSQADMAHKCGVSRETYSNWENGKGLDFENAQLIAKQLDCRFVFALIQNE